MPHRVTKNIIVKGNVDTIYNLWADFENFPSFMQNIKSVTKTGEGTSHWVMAGPLGKKVEWDAETTALDPNQRIGWSSKNNSSVTTSGQVTFHGLPKDQTEVSVTLQYEPPAGLAGDLVAELFSNPEAKLEEDLKNFKKYAESRVSQA